MTVVREAMLTDPRALPAAATAQEAAELLVRPEVRAVLVVGEEDRLLGVVTPPALVERVVAAGLDPRTTRLAEVVDPNVLTVDPDMPLEDAYRLMEEEDCERLAVTERGRLLGVLSRSALRRRLAEDEPPDEQGAE